ncbi:MAG: ABC transporter permease [Chitinophagaceae bacterium]
MLRFLEITIISLKMALQEFRSNKLRTFLSLFGITVGIFCIISVLATVDSLKTNIKSSFSSLGNNTIYIQKRPWGSGGPNEWWKYNNRPSPRYEESVLLQKRLNYAENIGFITFGSNNVEFEDQQLTGVTWYAVSEGYVKIQPLEIEFGRYISDAEFLSGSNAIILGYTNAENLFVNPQNAVGKPVVINGRKMIIVGVPKKYGNNNMGGWDFDNIVLMPYRTARNLANKDLSEGFIMVKGKDAIPVEEMKMELDGAYRSVRKLSPVQQDNFALNEISSANSLLDTVFSSINLGGWFIAGLSLIVGMFGVANIMFVTVRERTGQIGLKKAIGAKRSTIITEFLLESAFLCILGGLIGLVLVYILTKILSPVIGFPITISLNVLSIAITICIFTGILAGIIPAVIAARMDPVVAIRSK